MNLSKLVCAIFTLYQLAFVISFREERAKVAMVKLLKYLEPTNWSWTIVDSAKQTKWNFWD